MKIGSYTVRPFCVTLPEKPEKWKAISSHWKERGIEAEPFFGIYGEVAGVKTLHPYELDAPGSGWNMGIKPVAMWLSAYMLWSAMNVLPDAYFWHLEDDCRFPENWRDRTEGAMRDVPPDFDILFIGSCCAQDHPKKHVAGEVFETKQVLCTHSFIIAHKALPVLLRTQRKVYAPIDISMKLHSFPFLKVFVVLPRICDQFDTVLPP